MKTISYPQCDQSGTHFVITRNQDLSETVRFPLEDFPVAVYTQHYDHAASDQVPIHWHRELQAVWVYEGSLSYHVQGHTFPLDRGKVLVINRHLLHSSRTVGADARTLCIHFKEQIFHPMILKRYLKPVLEDPSFSHLCLSLKPQYLNALERFLQWEAQDPDYFMAANFLAQLAEDLVKSFQGNQKPVDYAEAHQFRSILQYVHSHYMENLTVTDLARCGHVNKNRLTALFRKYTGMPPIKYLNEYRLYVSKELITATDRSISEISEEVGYRQISHFIQQFKKSYGITPLKYRAQYGKASSPPLPADGMGDGASPVEDGLKGR